MPTGYTAMIEEDGEFEDFILGCAKAFGACVMMRDESSDTPIPEKFEESTYEKEQYEKAILELEKYEKMSLEEAEKKSEEEYNKSIKDSEYHLEKIDRKEDMYKTMLEKVNLWNPPTPEHIGLKDFMIQQIDVSMDNGSSKEYYSLEDIIKYNGKQWLHEKIKMKKEDIEYYMKRWKEETKRNQDRNKWIKDLRESI